MLAALLFTLILAQTPAATTLAPPPPPESLLTSWPAAQRDSYLAQERALNAIPTADSLREDHILLASEPHVAGTDADAREIERLRKFFSDQKLEVQVFEFWPYLCTPVAAQLDIVRPDVLALDLKERPLKEDPASGHEGQNFGWNAYSGS